MVNNAGISGSSRRLMQDDLRDFDRVIAVDLYGVMVGTQRAARAMGPGGSIINITSIAGITPGPGFSTYRAAKAAVIHFSRSAAIEVGELGVRVNVIAPGQHLDGDQRVVVRHRGGGSTAPAAAPHRRHPRHRQHRRLPRERTRRPGHRHVDPRRRGHDGRAPADQVGRHQARRRGSRPDVSQTSWPPSMALHGRERR